jgi:hypothetical protein
MSCAGMVRGGGGCATVGGRQVGGGGSERGGPAYGGSAGCAGFGATGRYGSASPSGRFQYSSSGTPVGVLTFTDGTASGGRRAWRRGPTLVLVDILDQPEHDADGERTVDFDSEEAPLLPEQTRDDTERGWGETELSNDDRLLEDRPPHWD